MSLARTEEKRRLITDYGTCRSGCRRPVDIGWSDIGTWDTVMACVVMQWAMFSVVMFWRSTLRGPWFWRTGGALSRWWALRI